MGKHDLPSIVDYILSVTGQVKLSYVGHSMGTTMFFIFVSERPEYNDKIKVMFALAPVVYLQGPVISELVYPFQDIHVSILLLHAEVKIKLFIILNKVN